MENFDKKELVKNVASLANLQFDDNETEKLATQFEKIVFYISKIEELEAVNYYRSECIYEYETLKLEDYEVASVKYNL